MAAQLKLIHQKLRAAIDAIATPKFRLRNDISDVGGHDARDVTIIPGALRREAVGEKRRYTHTLTIIVVEAVVTGTDTVAPYDAACDAEEAIYDALSATALFDTPNNFGFERVLRGDAMFFAVPRADPGKNCGWIIPCEFVWKR